MSGGAVISAAGLSYNHCRVKTYQILGTKPLVATEIVAGLCAAGSDVLF